MNNNRNNRRRGRGNRNQSGGGNQLNRIDSRARGNAPQLLDKYKKLAQDAQHNGDRVQMEQYLQFADHYYRVIADNKARQDEARAKRGDGRNDGRDQSGEDNDQRAEDGDDNDNRRNDNRADSNRSDSNRGDRTRGNRRGRSRRDENDGVDAEGEFDRESDRDDQDADGKDSQEASTSDEPERKPRRRRAAVKDANGKDDAPPKRTRKPRAKKADLDTSAGEIDSSVLPPAIGSDSSSSSDGDDTLEVVG